MVLQVKRTCADQAIRLLQKHKLRVPTRVRYGAATGLKGSQVFMAHEWGGIALCGQERIPLHWINACGGIYDPDDIIVCII